MCRTLLRWLIPLFGNLFWVSLAHAAPLLAKAAGEGSDDENRNPALQYVMAILFTAVIMVILCVPSRKRED